MQYAFNLFSHNAPVLSNGYNEEEMKLVKETRKIWVSVVFDILEACHVFGSFAEKKAKRE